MRVFHLKRNIHYLKSVNLDKIAHYVPKAQLEEAKKSGQAVQVDLTKLGYFKVLGKGHLPAGPIVLKAKYFSRKAEKRVKQTGGACVLTA